VDYSLLRGIYKITSEVQFLSQEVEIMLNSGNNTVNDVRAFFESDSFRDFDKLVFYQTIAMKQISGDYMEEILRNRINQTSVESNTIQTSYFILVLLYLVMYRLVRIRQLMQKWTNLQDVFMISNDSVVNNVYVKAFFRNNKH
jgi:hypothetical protein